MNKIDDLCGVVFPTSLYFDRSGPGCIPFPDWVGYSTGGNDCTVWNTGWKLQSIDIFGIAPANQNKPVTIRFSAGDVGDSIFDPAILLDAIEINRTPWTKVQGFYRAPRLRWIPPLHYGHHSSQGLKALGFSGSFINFKNQKLIYFIPTYLLLYSNKKGLAKCLIK